jgi:hypothetical protein
MNRGLAEWAGKPCPYGLCGYWCALAGILILVFTAGCKVAQPLPVRETVIETREVVRDSLVVLPADSSLIRALIECDSTGKASITSLPDVIAGLRTRPPGLSIGDNNILTAKCDVDSLAIYLALKDRYYKEVETVVETIEVNRLRWWQTTLMWLGVIVCGYIVFLWAGKP